MASFGPIPFPETTTLGPLADDAIHIWRAGLRVPPHWLEAQHVCLSGDETARAARFIREEHRRRFAAGRVVLRLLLARYLNAPPGSFQFEITKYGKPFLVDYQTDLTFNVSHSDDLALFAFARGRAVGVDIEKFQERLEIEKIARRYFSSAEIEALFALPEEQRVQAFYNGWTRKEAYIKARGLGLSIGLDTFDVTLAPGAPPAILRARDDDPARWSVFALDPAPGFAAALVTEGRNVTVQTSRFDPDDFPPSV